MIEFALDEDRSSGGLPGQWLNRDGAIMSRGNAMPLAANERDRLREVRRFHRAAIANLEKHRGYIRDVFRQAPWPRAFGPEPARHLGLFSRAHRKACVEWIDAAIAEHRAEIAKLDEQIGEPVFAG